MLLKDDEEEKGGLKGGADVRGMREEVGKEARLSEQLMDSLTAT